jgi:hypothetical protein
VRYLIVLITIPLVNWLIHQSNTRKAQDKDGVVVFAPATWTIIVFSSAQILFSCMALYAVWVEKSLGLSLGFGAFALIGAFLWPKTITVSSQGIAAISPLRPSKSIHWSDLSEVKRYENPSAVVLKAQNGRSITHSSFHRDEERLLQEIRSRSRVQIISARHALS